MLVITCLVMPFHPIFADASGENVDVSVDFVGCSCSDPYEGLPMYVKADVLNLGNSSVENVSVRIYLDNESNILFSDTISSLQGNESYRLSLDWNATLGNHSFIAEVDYYNSINESNESNNDDVFTISVSSRDPLPLSGSWSTWREGESWNYSYNTISGELWEFIDDENADGASSEIFTRQRSILWDEDYAEWNFTVYEADTYYIWVRGYYKNKFINTDDSCHDVQLSWINESTHPIGSENWCVDLDDWKWTNFGDTDGIHLSEGDGTLHIEGNERHYIPVDNILITTLTPGQFTPSGKGLEGCENYTIGNSPPRLSCNSVTPETGNDSTVFTYEMIYDDIDGDEPVDSYIFIDGEKYTMSRYFYSPGPPYHAIFRYNTTLSVGNHFYCFNFSDGTDYTSFPVYGIISGPVVYELPNISMDSYSIDDDYNDDSFGNNNSLIEAGETIELHVFLKNNGGTPASDVSAVLSENDPLITSINGSCSYGDIDADEVKEGVFTFEVDVDHADQADVPFSLSISDENGSSWYDSFSLDVFECPGLDYRYIRDVTEWLSNVTFNSYLPGELSKGRAFGSQGEHDSANRILYWMNQLGLNPTMEQITDIDNSLYNRKFYFDELDDKLQINAREAEINGQPVECYISPQWNDTILHPFGDRTGLTHTVDLSDLNIYHRPMSFFDYFRNFVWEKRDIINSWEYNGSNSFLEFIIDEYENYHDFTFEELNETNAFDIFPWFNVVYGQYSSADCDRNRTLGCSPFVYIGEDPAFNPNGSVPVYYSWINEGLRWLVGGMASQIERLIWYKTLDQCYGLILYDFNDHSFDMNYDYLMALPTIYINGSIGGDINQSVGDYTLDYYIDQEWNPSVTSYNVIGEIPGNNSGETVIICCLYDSWWNQGTADSAIGIGMMLSIAKYYQDRNIIPERNMKFIAFGGEEYGMRGAFHYEAAHLYDETVTTVVDLNQLGFTQNTPRLTLNLISNSDSVNTTVSDIVDDTNYVERTGDVTDLRMITTDKWNPVSDYMPFADATKRRYRPLHPRSCKTICFVKDMGENPDWRWILHHRDGENHTRGDVFTYYDELDVHVTAEMILNVTRYFETESEPLLDYEPSRIQLGELMVGTSDSTSFEVWNSGAGTLTYSLSESYDWITLSSTSGNSNGEHDTITIDIDTTGLSMGNHTSDILLSSNDGSGVITVNVTVIGSPPVADFGYEPLMPETNELIYFNSSSYDLGGTIIYWNWTMGDGTELHGEHVAHSYAVGDSYQITLNVTDDEGYTDEVTYSVYLDRDMNTNVSLNRWWNFISLPVNETVSKESVYVSYDDTLLFDWSGACSSGLIIDTLFSWTRPGQGYWFSNSLEPGYGYWLFSFKDNCKIWVENDTVGDDYITTVEAGWNLIGLPFDQEVSKQDVLVDGSDWGAAVSSGMISDVVYNWNQDQSYNFADTFIPGCGYWVYSNSSHVLSRGGKGGSYEHGNDVLWQMNITTRVDVSNASLGRMFIGESTVAMDGISYDVFDAPIMPSPPGSSYVTISSNDTLSGPYQCLFRDFRRWPDTEKTWNLTVSYVSNNQSNATVNLTWNNSTLAASEYKTILLYDNITDTTIDMLAHTYYRINMTPYTNRFLQILCTNGTLPVFDNVSATPETGGFGTNITLSAEANHLFNDINTVNVNVTYPNDSTSNYTMNNTEGNTYQYVFDDTWQIGIYQYRLWATDTQGNISYTKEYEFTISANATIQVCTVKNTYTGEEEINVTDPPTTSISDIGYELLDDGQVLHVWNRYDSYYFDTDSGIQLTNHEDEYWSHNVLMLGYYNNDNWNLIYRTDELTGFHKSIDTDNKTFVNATLWKDLSYYGYEFRLAIRYHLGLTDNELTVIPYIKNLGDPIPYTLGFAWEINDIRIDDTPENDYILINDSYYWLNESLDLSFKNLSKPIYCWNETMNESVVCGFEPLPYFHIQENLSSNRVRSLYLRWNQNLNYKVWIHSRNESLNAPVVLGIRIGSLDASESKQTSLYWYDADQQCFYFDDYSPFETWTSNPGYMVDNDTGTFASTSMENDVEKCTGTSCPDIDPGKISKVEIRAYAKHQGGSSSLLLRPVFEGGDGDNHGFELSPSASWSDWFDVTDDSNAPEWTWKDITTVNCDVESYDFHPLLGSNPHCAKVEIRVTYSPWTPPSITNPTPGYGSMNVSIQPRLGITVADDNGDSLDISWLSNCSGSWQEFATNNSVGNGTYYQTFEGAVVNGQWWYWMLNVSDDHDYNLSSVFKFYTGTQSKLVNTGNTTIRGYLLMQAEYWNGTSWITDQVVIDDASPRTLNASGVLGLDTVFNGLLETGDLSYGDGEYRVYAALCDSYGEVLVTGDSALEAWWSFELDLI